MTYCDDRLDLLLDYNYDDDDDKVEFIFLCRVKIDEKNYIAHLVVGELITINGIKLIRATNNNYSNTSNI